MTPNTGKATTEPLLCRNPMVARGRQGFLPPGRDDIPCLPAKAPFIWRYMGTAYDMEFVGGLIGIAQDPATLCLRPEIGWAVRDALA
jgi:hypothetical protein